MVGVARLLRPRWRRCDFSDRDGDGAIFEAKAERRRLDDQTFSNFPESALLLSLNPAAARLLSLNPAAARLLSLNSAAARPRRSVHESGISTRVYFD